MNNVNNINQREIKSLLEGFKHSPDFDASESNCKYIANLLELGKQYGLEIQDFQRYISTSITREDSPYGNMKWHLIMSTVNGKYSEWFKTKLEAEYTLIKILTNRDKYTYKP